MSSSKLAALAGVSFLALIGLGSSAPAQQAQSPQTATPQPTVSPTQQPAEPGTRARVVPIIDTRDVADADMLSVLVAQDRLGVRPLHALTPEEARRQPSMADAVKAILQNEGRTLPTGGAKKQDLTYPTAGGTQPIRIYTPDDAGQGPLPVIVFYHGGGWVIADINTYEASALALAKKTKAIVASVEYRHGPETKFPGAHDDANAAYRWVLENAASFGGDPRRVALAGESAGGNLAVNVAQFARDQNLQRPAHMLLVYPVAGTDTNTRSYQEHALAKPLNKATVLWMVENYTKGPQDLADPRLNLVASNLRDLPPATIILADIDPLRSDGQMLAEKLRGAGGRASLHRYEGATHEFFGLDAVVRDAERAQNVAARELREALATGPRAGQAGGNQGGAPAQQSR